MEHGVGRGFLQGEKIDKINQFGMSVSQVTGKTVGSFTPSFQLLVDHFSEFIALTSLINTRGATFNFGSQMCGTSPFICQLSVTLTVFLSSLHRLLVI